MESLRIFRISENYVRYLSTRDSKVQMNKKQRRPYVGVVLTVGEFRYFVPMESPKPNHVNIKNGKHILKLDDGRLGMLGFNNMIPVHDAALIPFDIRNEPEKQYRELLIHQADECNKRKLEIYDRASRTYYDVVNKKNKFLVGISCDFKNLEKACRRYDPNYKNSKAKTKQ